MSSLGQGSHTNIPCYRSSRVFKIGTGDIFSAAFAHYWAELCIPATEAADRASRCVAAYCNSGALPLDVEGASLVEPIRFVTPGVVAIEASADTIGQRYTLEEARFVLRELGTEVLEGPATGSAQRVNTSLILADGLAAGMSNLVDNAIESGRPVIVLQERGVQVSENLARAQNVITTDDFTTAIYFAAWAAAEHSESASVTSTSYLATTLLGLYSGRRTTQWKLRYQ